MTDDLKPTVKDHSWQGNVLDIVVYVLNEYEPEVRVHRNDNTITLELDERTSLVLTAEFEHEAGVNEILDFERLHAVGFEPDEITAALQDPTRRRLV